MEFAGACDGPMQQLHSQEPAQQIGALEGFGQSDTVLPGTVDHAPAQGSKSLTCTSPQKQRMNLAGQLIERKPVESAGRKVDALPAHVGDRPGQHATRYAQGFWREVFSAATMILPSAYAACFASSMAETAQFPQGIWAIAYATYVHCIASVAFHLHCAYLSGTSFNHFESPLRVADMVLIHACCIFYGWAVSPGGIVFLAANLVCNSACMIFLVCKSWLQLAGTKQDSYRVIFCILVYTSAMLWRCDWSNYFGVFLSYGVGGIFWTQNAKLDGWGHGMFHMCLTPCIYCVMRSASRV